MQDKINERKNIRDDYYKTYFRIVSECGICRKSNEYAEKIERLENIISKAKG